MSQFATKHFGSAVLLHAFNALCHTFKVVCFSRTQNCNNFGGDLHVDCLRPLTPGAKTWMIKAWRLLTGSEAMAIQGMSVADLSVVNAHDGVLESRKIQLAGESFNMYSLCLVIVSVLSQIEL